MNEKFPANFDKLFKVLEKIEIKLSEFRKFSIGIILLKGEVKYI